MVKLRPAGPASGPAAFPAKFPHRPRLTRSAGKRPRAGRKTDSELRSRIKRAVYSPLVFRFPLWTLMK
jgi:hypothetical protein